MIFQLKIKEYIAHSLCGAPLAIGKLEGGGKKYKKGGLTIPLSCISLFADYEDAFKNNDLATVGFRSVESIRRTTAEEIEITAGFGEPIVALTIRAKRQTIDAIMEVFRKDSWADRTRIFG